MSRADASLEARINQQTVCRRCLLTVRLIRSDGQLGFCHTPVKKSGHHLIAIQYDLELGKNRLLQENQSNLVKSFPSLRRHPGF